jgi:hypothetical protein
MLKIAHYKYSVSCDFSAAPVPGQSDGTRPAGIETKRSYTGTEKYSS